MLFAPSEIKTTQDESCNSVEPVVRLCRILTLGAPSFAMDAKGGC